MMTDLEVGSFVIGQLDLRYVEESEWFPLHDYVRCGALSLMHGQHTDVNAMILSH